VGRPTAVAK